LSCLNTKSGSSGFTLLEALIALTLTALIGTAVFSVFPDALVFCRRITEQTKWNRELIRLERALRESVSDIRIPYWIEEIEITYKGDVLNVPYWRGKRDLLLNITMADGDLKIATPSDDYVFRGYVKAGYSLLKNSAGQVIGIELRVEKNDREPTLFQCAFGAIGRGVFEE